MHNETLVKMGFVRGAFGVKGWLKITANTEQIENLLKYPIWHLGCDDDWQVFDLITGKVTPDGLIVQLKGINDRETAHHLKSKTIAVARESFAPTKTDEFYLVDLMGLNIRNKEDSFLGVVSNIMQTGAHDILVIVGEHGETLIPFVNQYVINIDLAAQTILVDWELNY